MNSIQCNEEKLDFQLSSNSNKTVIICHINHIYFVDCSGIWIFSHKLICKNVITKSQQYTQMAQHSNHQHQSGCTQSVSGLIPYKFDLKGK